MSGKREFGDYQTPEEFAESVCEYVKNKKGIAPEIVIEPTCGMGSFIKGSLMFPASSIVGIELNSEYCDICKTTISDPRVTIINTDFFGFDLRDLVRDYQRILVIGNPPWVTNSTLSALDSHNLPQKVNFKGLKGMDAITGASNFDICEYMILQIISSLRGSDAVIAMLCKTSVARNVFLELKRENVSFSECEMLEFDSSKVFGISASACVLYVHLSLGENSCDSYKVYDFESGIEKTSVQYVNGKLQSNLDNIPDYNGSCEFEWRQGVKHDCSKVMELDKDGDCLVNGFKQKVDIEDTIVFPLIKSSMFKFPVIKDFKKYVLVTQHKVREDTSYLSTITPKTWAYLQENIELFQNRKSSIYRGAPEFSMFGIGDYSYSRYKVGVSGFYKTPLFAVLYSEDEKPVMTDDTSYFICFDSYENAYVAMLILNSDKVQAFLKSIAFLDAKRPYTKKVLERLSVAKAIKDIDISDLEKTEARLGLPAFITDAHYRQFKKIDQLSMRQLNLPISE